MLPYEVLMSSHRDYASDLEWSWLRNNGTAGNKLRFEAVEDSDNIYELIVDKSWTTLVR